MAAGAVVVFLFYPAILRVCIGFAWFALSVLGLVFLLEQPMTISFTLPSIGTYSIWLVAGGLLFGLLTYLAILLLPEEKMQMLTANLAKTIFVASAAILQAWIGYRIVRYHKLEFLQWLTELGQVLWPTGVLKAR